MPNDEIRLTSTGQQQAEHIGQWLHKTIGNNVDSLYVSRYIRTQDTAQPFIQLSGLEPSIIDGLEEFNYLPFDQIAELYQPERHKLVDQYWKTSSPATVLGNDTESFQHFADRVDNVLNTFRQVDSGTHVAFTHGTWLSMLAWQVLGNETDSADAMRRFRLFEQALRIPNTAVYRLTLSDQQTALQRHYAPTADAKR